jgi:hypothetical protein
LPRLTQWQLLPLELTSRVVLMDAAQLSSWMITSPSMLDLLIARLRYPFVQISEMNLRKLTNLFSTCSLLSGIIFSIFFIYHFGPIDIFPRQIQSTKNSEGSLSVKVYRKKKQWFCTAGCTEIVVKIYTEDSNTVYEKRISTLGFWDDTDSCYIHTRFEKEQIRIGPTHNYHSEVGYYEISKAEMIK